MSGRSVVVIPTYNERENILQMLDAVLSQPCGLDVLIVDDNSPDGTGNLVAEICAGNARVQLLRREGLRGLGLSYLDGFKKAIDDGYKLIFEMDADFYHAHASLSALFSALESHDMVLGSRYCKGRVSVLNWPVHRLIMSMFGGSYVRAITGMKYYDPTSGFRGFHSRVLSAIGLDTIRSNGYCFQVEVLYRAHKCGFDIHEESIVFTERREGQSKMSRRIVLEAALMPWRLKFGRQHRGGSRVR